MKIITLTRGKVALVDDEDFKYLIQWKWYAKKSRKTFYAVRTDYSVNPKGTTIRMHRQIMGVTEPDVETDHVDNNGLNNQKSNLRLCTTKQNGYNKAKHKPATSVYKGVSWHKRVKKWHSQIFFDGKKFSLGYFENEKDAAKAYNLGSIKYHGQFGKLNMFQ